MKVLWIEDHPRLRQLISIAADHASRRRLPLDLVFAPTLMDAEARLRRERFDLAIVDLRLPDAFDEETTLTRLCTFPGVRFVICSASEEGPRLAEMARRAGCACGARVISKSELPVTQFTRAPQLLHDWIAGLIAELDAAA